MDFSVPFVNTRINIIAALFAEIGYGVRVNEQ